MIRCYLVRNGGLSHLERRFISQLFYRIAKVLDIQDEDVACAIDLYVRRSPAEPAGTFSMTESNPYKIKLANLFVEPPTRSPFKQMGRSLAHEMIHLKQRLRDGLTVTVDSTSTTLTRRFFFKDQAYNSDEASPDSTQKQLLPFEEEAHSLTGKVFRQAVEAKSQTALTNSADTTGNSAEATVMFIAGYDTVEHEQAPDGFSDLQEHLECVLRRNQPASRDEQLEEQQKAVWAAARKVAKHSESTMGGDLTPCVQEDIAGLKLALENHDQWGRARVNSLMSELNKSFEKFKSTTIDPLMSDMEKALERQRREGRRYRKGDKVYIINRSAHGAYYFEGRATVIRPTGTKGQHFVHFGDGTPVERFIHEKAQENLGNEIDRLNSETDRLNWRRDSRQKR